MSQSRHYLWMLIRITAVLTVLLSLVAGVSSTRTAGSSTPFFAACTAPCIENFDGVTFPALPAGWTTTVATGQPGDVPWKTNPTSFDSAPNSAFVETVGHATDISLDSPAIPIASTGAILTFKKRHGLELLFDGMVLEISIPSVAGGAFQDIITAQGSFIEGGYNSFITSKANSPIAGRQAWTGFSPAGFTITTVKLPDSASGQSVRFRWRVVTDESISGFGANIDSVAFVLPPNDNFSDAQPILGRSGIIIGSNTGATKEASEPNGLPGGASVWYKWQAPETGRFVFTTFDSSFRTVLAVYTGNTPPTTPLVSNTGDLLGCLGFFGGEPSFSRVAFDAVGGVFYYIAVDRRSTADTPGNIVLRWGGSATITGRVSDVSGRHALTTPTIELHGATCRRTESDGGIRFTDVPKGHNYDVSLQVSFPNFAGYSRWGTTASISPLGGDVSDYNFYQSSPTVTITAFVMMPGGNTSGVQVTCVSKSLGVFATAPVDFVITQTARDLGGGQFQCGSLQIGGDWVVTPSKLGFAFTPPSVTATLVTQDITIFQPFTGSEAPPRTISGRVTLPNGTTGVSGVTIGLSGSVTGSQVTNANGDYSFTGILQGGNYTVTPSNANATFTPPSSTFNNLNGDQTANFTANFLLQLILEESGQVAALDAVLHTRDPFPVVNNSNLELGVDRNTRVVVFVPGLTLGPGELPSAVTINLVGSNNQTYDIPAEDVRLSSEPTFTQIIFRLPDNLAPGICTLAVKYHGLTSNIGAMRIK